MLGDGTGALKNNTRIAFAARILSVFVVILICTAVSAQTRLSPTEELVRITFTSFKHAILAKDGVRASQLIDDDTAALHEKLRQFALNTSKPVLLKERFSTIVAVLAIRHAFSKDDIQNISGRAMYGKTIARGDAGAAKAIPSLSIVKVTPDKNNQSAEAELGMEGFSETVGMRFRFQRGSWRINLTELAEKVSTETEDRIGITPRTPPEVIESVITQLLLPALSEQSKRPVSDEIWIPLAQRS